MNAKRKEYHVRGEDLDIRDYDDKPSRELFRDLQNLLDAVPEEYRNDAVVEVDVGEYSHSLQIKYIRPETDEEMAARLKRDTDREGQQEARERRMYEVLKKKFGDTS